MDFYFNGPENTYEQTTLGGTLATAAKRDVLSQWVKALEPWETPILDRIMSNEEISEEVHQWGQSKRIPLSTTVVTAPTTTAGTTFTVTAGQAALIQAKSIIEMYAVQVGTQIPDMTKYETMWVTGVNQDTNTITVDRAYGTAAYGSHAPGAVVNLLGTAEELNSEHTEAPRIRGYRSFNYPQRFHAKLQADKRVQNMATHEHPTNVLLSDFEEEMKKQKILLERSAFRGRRVAGIGNTKPSTFGGLDYFITSNVVNMAAAKLGPNTLDDVLADLWLTSDAANQVEIVCSMTTARILDTSIPVANREVRMTEGEYNKVVRTYHFRTGSFTVTPTRNVPDGVLYFLNFRDIKMRPFKGLNWHVTGRNGQDFAVDHDIKAVSGDFTLEVLREQGMAKIFNFLGTLSSYP